MISDDYIVLKGKEMHGIVLKKNDRFIKLVLIIEFVSFIGFFCAYEIHANFKSYFSTITQFSYDNANEAITSFENYTSYSIPFQSEFIKLDSLRNRLYGYYVYEDNSGMIIRDDRNRLHSLSEKMDDDILQEEADAIVLLKDYCSTMQIPFIYVSAPFKAGMYNQDLLYGINDYSQSNAESVKKRLGNKEVDVIDLSDYLVGENLFYKTDHHWTIYTAFTAAKILSEYSSKKYGIGINSNVVSDISKYDTETYNDFLGSYGRRTGDAWCDREEFTYLFPSFKTNIHYMHIKGNEIAIENNGSFKEALISDPSQSDYYCSYMCNSYEEMVINNLMSDNESRILLISDSFGRTMGCFLSLYCNELRNIDTQDGRFDRSVYSYIQDYKPDMVVVMFNEGMFNYPDVFYRLAQ